MVSPGPSFLPGPPNPHWGRLPKRAASPVQNPCAGFRYGGSGVGLHRGSAALPRDRPLNNSLLTISLLSRPIFPSRRRARGILRSMARAATPLPLTPERRRILEAWRDAPQSPRQVAFRARLSLLAADGVSSRGVARALRTTLVTVLFWRRRFQQGGLTALTATAPGRGPRRRITARKVRQIVQATLRTQPPKGKRWTIESMARAQGVSPATVQRVWDRYGLKPRLAGRLQGMQGTVRDVVGLYLNPPDKVLILAWDRVPRRLAGKQSQDLAFTAEGKPTGLTGWWRALEEVERMVVGDSRKRAREQGFLSFLRRLERRFP